MKNSDMPAMPCQPLGQDGMPSYEVTYGLTKRELMAMHMMAAIRSRNSNYHHGKIWRKMQLTWPMHF